MAAIAVAIWLSAAHATDRALYLDVTVNGQSLELIGDFIHRDGAFYATRQELQALGILVPDEIASTPDGLVRLHDIPGLDIAYDEATQRIDMRMPNSARRPASLSAPRPVLGPASSSWGTLLNYSLVATHADGETSASMLAETRLFGPMGVLDSSVVADIGDRRRAIRLDTTWTFKDEENLRRVRVGDFISSSLPWTRPVRMAGVQVSRDFAIRPDLITFPTPPLRGAVDVPSTVDIYIDNVRQFSSGVRPGPFEVIDLPVITGSGEAQIVVRDVQGRQTIRTMPFYASNDLLRAGLVDYALQVGVVRRGYGVESLDYGGLAGSGSIRYGLSNSFTFEAHAETAADLVLGGAGFVAAVGRFGTVDAALAVSSAKRGTGVQYAFGYKYRSRSWNLSLSHAMTRGPYADIASLEGSPVPRSRTQASVGLSFDDGSNVSLAYVAFDGGDRFRSRTVSGSYSRQFLGSSQLFATAFVDLDDNDNYGAMLSVAMPLGAGGNAGFDLSAQSGQYIATARASYSDRSDVVDHGFNVAGEISQGDLNRVMAQAEWRTPWADAGLATDSLDGDVGVRAELRGSVILAGGGVFLSQQIEDSFAIVDAGLPNVGVMLENRPAGRTNEAGLLMVKGLRAYEANAMAIDVADLPSDADFDATRQIVVPSFHGGVVVQFRVRTGGSAILKLVDSAGEPLEPGSMLALGDGPASLPVGYEGLAYVSDLAPDNHATVTAADGTHCQFSFEFEPTPGYIPTLGPFICRAAS